MKSYKFRILIVEDETRLLSTMKTILEFYGYAVTTAGNGFEAWEKIKCSGEGYSDYDLIITDIQMPVLNGLDLIEKIRSKKIAIPVLAITGYGDKQMVIGLFRRGIVDYIDKPFNMDQLIQRVKNSERIIAKKSIKGDVHGNEKVKREIKELKEQLTVLQKHETIGQLTGGIVHDINNNLCAISGSAQLLTFLDIDKQSDRIKGKFSKCADNITRAVASASGLLGHLSSFTKDTRDSFKPVSIHEVLEDTLTLSAAALGGDVTIEKQFNAFEEEIKGSKVLLQNVILNLLLNAKDAMPGGGRITISTGVTARPISENPADILEPMILISIQDTGTGMDENLKSNIFRPYFTTKGKGTGMGLASVRHTVEQHNGSIKVESEPGKGSQFNLCFPLEQPQPASKEVHYA